MAMGLNISIVVSICISSYVASKQGPPKRLGLRVTIMCPNDELKDELSWLVNKRLSATR